MTQSTNKPLVSVLVPVYNCERYVAECIESILNQDYENIQLVIYDDGSTDNSYEVCKRFTKNSGNVELYHGENKGVATARNKLLEKTKGEYFLFVDSDDWIEPEMISSLLNIVLKQDLDVAICSHVMETGKDPGCIIKDKHEPEIWHKNLFIKEFILHQKLNGSLCNKLIKTSLIENVHFNPQISYGEDALVIWEILKKSDKIGITASTYYHYRMNDESISHQRFGEKKMGSHYVWEHFYLETVKYFPDYQFLAKANFAVSDFWLLYFAAIEGFKQNKAILTCRQNVKSNINLIHKLNLLNKQKLIAATCLAYAYPLISNGYKLFNKL